MLKKLRISLIFSNLVVSKTLSTIIISMHNFIAKFREILDICKHFAGNHVNGYGNIPRRGVVPKFSDIEVVALSITAEALSIDSEKWLFKYKLTKLLSWMLPLIMLRILFDVIVFSHRRMKESTEDSVLVKNGHCMIRDYFPRLS